MTQAQVARALVRLGGVGRAGGKGSHQEVLMSDGHTVTVPRKIKVGFLADVLKDTGISIEDFLAAL